MSKLVSNQPLWAEGPGEILQRGINMLYEDTDSSRRISMILIDNAVELIIKTYLTLPSRVSGINISRKERDNFCATFPTLLDGLEAHASKKIIGLDLGEFEWFHRLRNELYHQGNGLTVAKRNVEVYAELAEKLFEALFDCKLNIEPPKGGNTELIGEFFERWIEIEQALTDATGDEGAKSPSVAADILRNKGQITKADYENFLQLQIIRNELIHGEAEPAEMLRESNMDKVKSVASTLKEVSNIIIGIMP